MSEDYHSPHANLFPEDGQTWRNMFRRARADFVLPEPIALKRTPPPFSGGSDYMAEQPWVPEPIEG